MLARQQPGKAQPNGARQPACYRPRFRGRAPVRRRRERTGRLGGADRGKRRSGGRKRGARSRTGRRRRGRRMTTAFKILTAQQWADFERERVFRGAPVDVADGYIHLRSEEHTSELQSLMRISYAVFCLQKKN